MHHKFLRNWISRGGIIYIKSAQWYSTFHSMMDKNYIRVCQSFLHETTNDGNQNVQIQRFYDLGITNYDRIASGSIASVYVGERNGQFVCIKIQHPYIKKDFILTKKMILNLKNICTVFYPQFRFKLKEFLEIIETQFDFTLEAKNYYLFSEWYTKDRSFLKIPNVHYSEQDIIVMEYIPSIPIHKFDTDINEIQRVELMIIMKSWILDMILIHHCMHGDLHNGNWGISENGDYLVLYDLGYIFNDIKITPEFISNLFQNKYQNIPSFLFDILEIQPNETILNEINGIIHQFKKKESGYIYNIVSDIISCIIKNEKTTITINKRIAYLINFLSFLKNIHTYEFLKDFTSALEYNYIILEKNNLLNEYRETILYSKFLSTHPINE